VPKKVQVTFSNGQWKLVRKLKGAIGDNDSEIVRNIVISYLSEKSYIKEEVVGNSSQRIKQVRVLQSQDEEGS
jgi:hypothetical protein